MKDSFSLFDKHEINQFLDDYSLTLNEFKQLLEMVKNEEPPDSLDIEMYKGFRLLKKKLRIKMTRELNFGADIELTSKVFRNRGWSAHVLVCGATGAGKSYLTVKLLTEQTINIDIILFTKVPMIQHERRLKREKHFEFSPWHIILQRMLRILNYRLKIKFQHVR